MNTFIFTKKETQIAKGIAILLMLYHHLFANNRIPATYISILPTVPIDFLSVLSEFGTICVSIFMVLTGIGLFYVSKKENYKKWCFHHFLHFVFHYWLIFILFVPAGFLFFEKHFVWSEFLGNLFLLSYSYNLEWWFIRIYLEILLLTPWIVCYIRKTPKLCFTISLIISFIGFLLHQSKFYHTIFIKELSNLFLWQFIFCIGFYIAYYQIFEQIFRTLKRVGLDTWWFSLIMLVLCIAIRQEPFITSKLKDPILSPLFIFFGVNLIKELRFQSLFIYLGKHSLNIWLIHTFFCYYYITDIVLLPHVTLLIFIWLILLSLGTSYIINTIEILILKGLKKWNKNRTTPNAIY